MIEMLRFNALPAGSAVTFLAALAKFPPVHIRVAITAGGKFQTGEFCKHSFPLFSSPPVANAGVAFPAGNLAMLAGQAETGAVMVEFCCRFPGLFGMAFLAGFCQLPAVLIKMATQAGSAQSQKGSFKVDFFHEFARIIPDKRWLVTIPA